MSKTMIGVVVAIVVVVLGGFIIYSVNKGGTEVADNTDTTNVTATTNKVAFVDVVKKGGTLTCSITENRAGTKVEGKIFMGNGMMRGDYVTKENGVNVYSDFIVRDGYTYTWSSLTPTAGIKVAIPVVGSSDITVNTSSFDVSQVSDYDCKSWTLDQSKFTVPTEITFTLTKAN